MRRTDQSGIPFGRVRGRTIAVGIILSVLVLAFGWAGVRQDVLGNWIAKDAIAPAGGDQMSATSGGEMTACVGQPAVGRSSSGSGARLIHGVLDSRPGGGSEPQPPAAAENWNRY